MTSLPSPSSSQLRETIAEDRLGGRVALAIAALVAVMSMVTLAGYVLGIRFLIEPVPGLATMSLPTVALCLGLTIALGLDVRRQEAGVRRLGVAVVALSGAVLVSRLVTGHDAISQVLQSVFSGDVPRSETSETTAFCAGLLAVGCIGRPRKQPSALLAVMAVIIAGMVILGYAYGIRDLYALTPFRAMALRTALAIAALSIGFLLANRESRIAVMLFAPGVTGRTTRRQLSFIAALPVVGLILIHATEIDVVGPGMAIAFLVTLTVAPFAILILRDAGVLTMLDNTRRANEQTILEKLAFEQRYRSLFTRLETGFCIVEVIFDGQQRAIDYRFLELNPAFAAQTGLHDAMGRQMREIAPDHEERWFETYGQVALTGEPVRFEHAAGSLGRYYDVSAFRIDAPEAHHVAILFNDISVRRRGELDLKALNETLEQRVAARATELEQAQEALRQSQKLEAIGQLTGGVAHDFNNLLTVIRSSADLLKRSDLPEPRRLRYVAAISDTVERAAKLTGQLLAFARRQALRPEVFDVGQSVHQLTDMMNTLAGSRIRIATSMPDAPCFINADPSQFDTAIINMAVNARDAMDGQGQLTVLVGQVGEMPAIRTHDAVKGPFVAVSLTDTGTGIPAEAVERIFEPFFTTKGVGKGTGLGLSQVYGFAKQSGGEVVVTSKLGEGSTFRLYLPEVDAPATITAMSEPEPLIDGHGTRVLVVEDNQDVGTFATQTLTELGYITVWAQDAEHALRDLAEGAGRFDIVFSDVMMPGMNGIELGQEIRRLYPTLPVVLTSGYSHVLAENGTYGFELLHKPYSVEQLSRILRKAATWQRRRRVMIADDPFLNVR